MKDIILMTARWYLAYALSYRDIEELMAERGIKVDHSTINRWVIHYSPKLEEEFRKNHKKHVCKSWRMDETYIKIKGKWHYLYRAVDKKGNTIDFFLSENRDAQSALHFFQKAIFTHKLPEKVVIDKSASNRSALDYLNELLIMLYLFGFPYFKILIRPIKYLNNLIEQDHRGIKRIVKPVMGFKAFHSAQATLSGIELHRMLRKGQHLRANNDSIFEQFYSLAA